MVLSATHQTLHGCLESMLKKKKNGAIKVLNLLNIKYLIIKLLFPLEQIRLSPN